MLEEEQQAAPPAAPQVDAFGNPLDASGSPPYDPVYIEQVRQEIELAHDEFQRLLNGRPRYYGGRRW